MKWARKSTAASPPGRLDNDLFRSIRRQTSESAGLQGELRISDRQLRVIERADSYAKPVITEVLLDSEIPLAHKCKRAKWSRLNLMTASRFKRDWWISSGAVCATALLHLLIGVPLLLGNPARKPHFIPDSFGAGSNAFVSSAQFPSSMTLIELTPQSVSDEYALEELASRGVELPQSLLIASEDARPAPIEFDEDAIEDSEFTQSVGDTQGRAALFGKYMGQVTARIERAWIRPRSAIGADRFECETKIEQDRNGRVLSVELRRCNGEGRWQRSLVGAIERASPLPAPPEPSVFTGTIVLSFDADEYQTGVSVEGEYEPAVRLLAENMAPTQAILSPGKTTADISSHQGNIELRIEGKNTTWRLNEQDEKAQ